MEKLSFFRKLINLEGVQIFGEILYKLFAAVHFWVYFVLALLIIDLVGVEIFSTGEKKESGLSLLSKLSTILFDRDILIVLVLTILMLLFVVILLIALFKNRRFVGSEKLEELFREGVNQLSTFSIILVISGVLTPIWSTDESINWPMVRAGVFIELFGIITSWVLRRFFLFISQAWNGNNAAVSKALLKESENRESKN